MYTVAGKNLLPEKQSIGREAKEQKDKDITSKRVSFTLIRFSFVIVILQILLFAVAVLNGFLYVAGGEIANDQCTPLKSVCRYDPRNSSWMQVASMQNCRQSFQIGVLNGALYAVGKAFDQKNPVPGKSILLKFQSTIDLRVFPSLRSDVGLKRMKFP